jgi:non-specific serine/threonine protein kinase/serine/threonine-protein kinase
MDPARWERVKDVFQDVFERAPAERAEQLDRAFADDPECRAEVERLLRAHGRASGFLDASPHLDVDSVLTTSDRRDSEPAVVRAGAYRVIRELGRGGMGTVYLAERDDPALRKTVAIKVVRVESPLMLRRFQTETRILAGLEHSGIARLYDGGTTDDGLPYFVMEYVPGESLLTYCEAHALSTVERVRLFRHVCDAVQFAHQSFIVHRDLKPTNILVTTKGEPKLLDFGIAKLLTPQVDGPAPEETVAFGRLLTPQFASPEQIRGEPITTASDVYSLGVILYELLSGCRPYRISGRSALEIERIVCEDEPAPPSSVATHRHARRQLRGDLDNIVLKALRKKPQDRYAIAAELADDLQRHLDGFPVRAQPDRFAYRARKFVVRRTVPLAAACAIVVAVAGGTLSTLAQSRRAAKRFDEVRTLAHAFLFDVYDAISALPGSVAARRLVVSRAQQYLDSLAREAGDDRRLTTELAESYLRLGDVQGRPYTANLGDTAGALDSYQKGLALLERQITRHPDDEAAQKGLSEASMNVAVIFMRQGNAEASEAAANRAISAAQALADRHPRDAVYNEMLAHAYMRLGQAQHVAARQTDSIARLQQVLATYRKALSVLESSGGHDEAFWQVRLSTVYFYIAYPLAELGERMGDVAYFKDALDSSLKGDAINRLLTAKSPERTDYARRLADGLADIGARRWHCCQDLAGALRDEEAALNGFQRILARDGQNLEARRDVANVYNNLGSILGQAHQRSRALDANHRALAIYEDLSRTDPTSEENRRYAAEVRARIATLEREQ